MPPLSLRQRETRSALSMRKCGTRRYPVFEKQYSPAMAPKEQQINTSGITTSEIRALETPRPQVGWNSRRQVFWPTGRCVRPGFPVSQWPSAGNPIRSPGLLGLVCRRQNAGHRKRPTTQRQARDREDTPASRDPCSRAGKASAKGVLAPKRTHEASASRAPWRGNPCWKGRSLSISVSLLGLAVSSLNYDRGSSRIKVFALVTDQLPPRYSALRDNRALMLFRTTAGGA